MELALVFNIAVVYCSLLCSAYSNLLCVAYTFAMSAEPFVDLSSCRLWLCCLTRVETTAPTLIILLQQSCPSPHIHCGRDWM